MDNNSRKRKFLSLCDKKKILIKYKEEKLPVSQLRAMFGISKTQVYDIINNKSKILEACEDNYDVSRKKIKIISPYEELNDKIFQWFCSVRSKNIPVSGPLIQEKALEVAAKMNLPEFKASNGWLDKWKKTNNVNMHKVCGEDADVNTSTVSDWKMLLNDKCVGYELKDIINADETGLFFRQMPDKTLHFKAKSCKGGKLSKERITVLITCSATGEKFPLWVIGKSAKPRCFKNVKLDELPCTYKNNNKAWMTSNMFLDYLSWLNKRMKLEKRKVLLFIDNAPSHPHDFPEMSNVKVKFLPPNTTSSTQPCDQGVIYTLKVHFRKLMLQSIIARIDKIDLTATELSKSINVYDAIQWLNSAWRSVKDSTIIKCFEKCGFNLDIDESDEENLPLAQLQEMMKKISPDLSAEEYVLAENEVETCDDFDPLKVDTGHESSDEEEDNSVNNSAIKSDVEFHKMLLMINEYAANINGEIASAAYKLKTLSDEHMITSAKKQSKIIDFFSRK